MTRAKRYAATFAALVFVAALAAAGWLAYYAHQPLQPAQLPLSFAVEKGSSLRSVARQMVGYGIIHEPWQFIAIAHILGQATKIQAGSYELIAVITPLQLLDKITRGEVSQSQITFIEGWTFKQLRKALQDHRALKNDLSAMSDAEILQALGLDESSPEGLFFPDTYSFQNGSSELSILRRANLAMQARVDELWGKRPAGLPFADPYEALILASIIEKETGAESERAMIAAVFVNRLRLGMRLQTDPSVIYGIGDKFDGNLRKRDLSDDHPYNTYTRAGLPPTPIAMPGLAALTAAFNPASSPVLYFVSRGDGSSAFSASLAEHNRAVNQFQKSPKRKP
ncbi:MAG: endolytic transglycosylase MltG [Burkholderiales bacterium]|nr:endolytic transglycosylase MltG [Pseudomonadota bacterium]